MQFSRYAVLTNQHLENFSNKALESKRLAPRILEIATTHTCAQSGQLGVQPPPRSVSTVLMAMTRGVFEEQGSGVPHRRQKDREAQFSATPGSLERVSSVF